MLTLNYLARGPLTPPRARPPLLLLLHGVGGNEEGLFKYAERFDPRFVVLSVRAPYALGPERYRWFDVEFTSQGPINNPLEAEQSRQLFVQFINDAVMAFGCDPRQVYLFGFSQGATLAYSVLLSAPQKLRGGALIAGRVLPEVAPLAASSAALAHLTLLIQHGRNDPVVPFSRGLAARDLFIELGVAVGFREYPAAHEVTLEMMDEAIEFCGVQIERTVPKPSLKLVENIHLKSN